MKRLLMVVFCCFILAITNAYASVIRLPQTGQSTCYDTYHEISCTGTGQDGDIRSGVAWPTPRFTDNLNGTIFDSLTGLVWSQDANTPGPLACNPGSAKSWVDLFVYARCLNQNSYLGFSDWRIPNDNELASLFQRQQPDPITFLTSQGFSNIQSDYYRSSTSISHLFSVNDSEPFYSASGYDTYFVWPVRGGIDGVTGLISLPQTGQTTCYDIAGTQVNCLGTGQDGELRVGVPVPEVRFIDNGNLTQTDQLTGLIWPKDTNAPGPAACNSGVYKNWTTALQYVACLNLNSYLGYNNWRLPNINELNSLVPPNEADHRAWLTSQGFTNVQNVSYYRYWSSTTDVMYPYNARVGGTGSGTVDKENNQAVWPVRGGQYGDARLNVAPAVKDFGVVNYGAPVSAVVTLSNNVAATTDLQINSIRMMGVDASQFGVSVGDGTNGSCGSLTPALPPNTSCTVTVSFNPTTRGDKSALLRVSGSDVQQPNQDVVISGTANVPTFTITPIVVGGGGSVTCTSPVDINLSSVCTIQADNGNLAILTDNGLDVHASVISNSYTIQQISENHTIQASFLLNATCGGSHDKTFTVAPASDFCLFGTATPLTGVVPWNWTCSGLNGGTSANCSTRIPQHPTVILPRTGQTKCYDTNGVVINCTGTGQDGAIRSGLVWPAQRFTDNQNGTLTDNLTTLVWAKDGNIIKTRNPEFDAEGTPGDGVITGRTALNYVKKLNLENYLGFHDWRLPNVNELKSLINYEFGDNRLWLQSQGFQYVSEYDYWSSSVRQWDNLWKIQLYHGYVTDAQYSINYGTLIPVRGGIWSETDGVATLPKTGVVSCLENASCLGTGEDGELQLGVAWPSPRFTQNSNTAVTDNLTGLIWTASANIPGPEVCIPFVPKTWQEALNYITCLNTNNYLGHSDWRLPNVVELKSMQPDNNFMDVSGNWYWTASTYANLTNYGWYVWLDMGGYVSIAKKDSKGFVWPVRGGQLGNSLPAIAPVAQDFGSVPVGSSISTDFLVSNNSSATFPLQVNALSIVGADASQFTLSVGDGSAGSCGTVTPLIQPGSSCRVTVAFVPTSGGEKMAALKMSSNDANNPRLEAVLTGSGVILNPTLQVIVTNSNGGGGTVTSSPAGISCVSGSCNSSFTKDSSVSLTATANAASSFGGWSGACTGTGGCTVVMSTDKILGALFNLVPNVRIGATPYGTLNSAYQAVGANGVIESKALTFIENLLLNRVLNITLRGGYADNYSDQTGYTTLDGLLTIASGSLVVDRIVVK